RRRADRLRAEPRPCAIARRRVEGDPVDDGVDAGEVGDVRRAHEGADPGEARDHLRVERPVRRIRHRPRAYSVGMQLWNGAPYEYSRIGRGLVFAAGACPLDEDGTVVGPGDREAQAARTVENLLAALAEAGAGG